MNGLVSIITPCFNTASYLTNLLDSILDQTYPNIEMIAVDDGSTDNTSTIIKSYIPRFNQKGFTLQYIYQENSGQSVAVCNALNIINGEFVVWPDSDDFYASSSAIEKMVNRFSELDDTFAMVRTQERFVEDSYEHGEIKVVGRNGKLEEPSSLFEDCLYSKNGFYYCPGAYMIKTDALKRSSKFPIHTSKRAGQNWQLMLPILYHYRCSSILEPLYNVVQRKDSHSRASNNYHQVKTRIESYRDTILNTLQNIVDIKNEDLLRYSQNIERVYTIELFDNAVNFGELEELENFYTYLKQLKNVPLITKIRYLLIKNKAHKLAHYVKALEYRLNK